MVDFKVVISTKDGKSVQREVKEPESAVFLGKKIGEVIKGESINLTGELQISGGSDYCGFPMRKDVPGTGRKRILAVTGIGLRKKGKGQRQRKTVCGNTIHAKISQINLKVVKEGKEKLGGEPEKKGAAEAPKQETKAEEKPKEEKKPEEKPKPESKKPAEIPKQEEKKEEAPKQEEKPKEEKKPEEGK